MTVDLSTLVVYTVNIAYQPFRPTIC